MSEIVFDPLGVKKRAFTVMGVLNTTPDSFSDGGQYQTIELALKNAEKMLHEGAHIIDVGGESSRPGSLPVDEKEETKRTIPIIREINKSWPQAVISIDTYKSKVAQKALDSGASLVNDIYAGLKDPNIVDVVKDYDCPYIVMHMQGDPKNMQKNPQYENPVQEVFDFLKKRVEKLELKGLRREQIVLDPGIGFGKKLDHNLAIIRNLGILLELKCELLLGVSRKKIIGEILDVEIADRLIGTTTLNAYGLQKGVSLFRVHDVKENIQALKVMSVLRDEK